VERLQTVSHYVKWISSCPAVVDSAGKAVPLKAARADQCSAAEVGHVMAAAGSPVPSEVSADRQPVIMHHTWARRNATNYVLFATTCERMGTKALSLISKGRNGDRVTRRHPIFVKHSAWLTAQAFSGKDYRRRGVCCGMFHGDDRLGLLAPEGSLVFLSPRRDRVSQSGA
jgi:hypothetical protein